MAEMIVEREDKNVTISSVNELSGKDIAKVNGYGRMWYVGSRGACGKIEFLGKAGRKIIGLVCAKNKTYIEDEKVKFRQGGVLEKRVYKEGDYLYNALKKQLDKRLEREDRR